MAGKVGRKFVVAVDEDEVSAYAFTWAITNLFRPADHIVIMTAKTYATTMDSLPTADVTAGEYAMPVLQGLDPDKEVEANARAQGLVDKFMRQCEQVKLTSEGAVMQGDPGPHIVAEVEKVGADAVVLGSHGRSLLGRTFLGSISDYVRHHSPVPVVVVRSSKDAPHDPLSSAGLSRKVVIAVDDSPEAAHAFAWALQHVVQEKDNLLLLHVQNPIAPPTSMGTDQFGMEDVYVPPDTSSRANVAALGDSERLVENFMKGAAEATKAHCEGRVVTGYTQDKVSAELSAVGADIAVVGSRGHDVLQRTFLGSVSDHLAHNSPCPVISVRLPKHDGTSTHSPSEHAHSG